MFRCILPAIRCLKPTNFNGLNAIKTLQQCNYKALSSVAPKWTIKPILNSQQSLLKNEKIMNISNNLNMQVRTVTKFSLQKGKRKTSKTVTHRFFRLHWGAWIRTRCGRHKKIWKKSYALQRKLRQHIFCNATQSTLLDKMVTNFWKRPKYYIDDPYTPYHTREEFEITRKKPLGGH